MYLINQCEFYFILNVGADWLGVATMDEAIELRENHITAPILLLGVWEPHVA